jgi:hypothetical protein
VRAVAEMTRDLPSAAPGATSLLDVTLPGCRQGDPAHAALASSTRFVELDAVAWTSNAVRVMARNISPSATFDLGPATLSIQRFAVRSGGTLARLARWRLDG